MLSNRKNPSFIETLECMASCLKKAGEPWMVFGGAALALHGATAGPIKDIDVILDRQVAERLSILLALENHSDQRSDRFRSDMLLRPDFGPIPVELLGGFRVKRGEVWIPIDCSDTVAVSVGSQTVFIPNRDRLASIFRLCGREKDMLRASLLSAR